MLTLRPENRRWVWPERTNKHNAKKKASILRKWAEKKRKEKLNEGSSR